MLSNKPFFGFRSVSKLVNKTIRPIIDYLLLFVLLLMLIKIVISIGFGHNSTVTFPTDRYYQRLFTLIAIAYLLRSIIYIGFKSFTSGFVLFSAIGLILF